MRRARRRRSAVTTQLLECTGPTGPHPWLITSFRSPVRKSADPWVSIRERLDAGRRYAHTFRPGTCRGDRRRRPEAIACCGTRRHGSRSCRSPAPPPRGRTDPRTRGQTQSGALRRAHEVSASASTVTAMSSRKRRLVDSSVCMPFLLMDLALLLLHLSLQATELGVHGIPVRVELVRQGSRRRDGLHDGRRGCSNRRLRDLVPSHEEGLLRCLVVVRGGKRSTVPFLGALHVAAVLVEKVRIDLPEAIRRDVSIVPFDDLVRVIQLGPEGDSPSAPWRTSRTVACGASCADRYVTAQGSPSMPRRMRWPAARWAL